MTIGKLDFTVSITDEAKQLRALLERSFEERCSRSIGREELAIIERWVADSRERTLRAVGDWVGRHGTGVA